MSKRPTENWYVAQLRPQGLKRAEENLSRQGFQSFCPKRLESALRNGRRTNRLAPLFPGYLFIAFDPNVSGWTAINSTRGISRLIITNIRNPVPLPASFMAGLMARCDEEDVVGAPPDLSEGDKIRVLSGPFAEVIARIESLQEGERIQILMDLMGQQTRISLPRNRVEKL